MSHGGNPNTSAPTWDVSRDRRVVAERNLTAAEIQQRIHRGDLSADDWVRPSRGGPWQQLGEADAFENLIPGSRRRRRRSASCDDELDMTPMIDMTFLLLIFFMVTASFHLQKGFHFPADNSPQEQSNEPTPAPGLTAFRDHLMIWVESDDSIRLDDGQGQPQATAVSSGELRETLHRISQERGIHKAMLIPDERASHEALVHAMDAANRAGLNNLALADLISGEARQSGSSGPPPKEQRGSPTSQSPAPRVIRRAP